jgi:steroid delta-isomerase-like uncharacterized protein
MSDRGDRAGEGRGVSGIEGVFALVGLIEKSFHGHTLDQLDALLDPHLVVHGPVPMEQGAEAFKRSLAMTRQAFPDMKITIEAGAAHEGLVFRRWSMNGTHRGTFLGIPPTGRPVVLSGVDIERLEGGRIVEHWTYWDRLSLAEQLGIPIPPGMPGRVMPAADASEG